MVPGDDEKKRVGRRLFDGAKRELAVFARTFLVAWGALAVALLVYAIATSPRGFKGPGDVVLTLAVGFLMMLFYAFWPAVAVACIRATYRAVGWAAFIPIPVVLVGVALSFWAFSGFLESLLHGVFASLSNVGPCGAHTGGPIALFCLAIAVVGSPAGIWALAKLFLGISLVVLLGATPGLALFVVLVARTVLRRWRAPS